VFKCVCHFSSNPAAVLLTNFRQLQHLREYGGSVSPSPLSQRTNAVTPGLAPWLAALADKSESSMTTSVFRIHGLDRLDITGSYAECSGGSSASHSPTESSSSSGPAYSLEDYPAQGISSPSNEAQGPSPGEELAVTKMSKAARRRRNRRIRLAPYLNTATSQVDYSPSAATTTNTS
jgi:hypothetical protein